jgi:hypothetical protein
MCKIIHGVTFFHRGGIGNLDTLFYTALRLTFFITLDLGLTRVHQVRN